MALAIAVYSHWVGGDKEKDMIAISLVKRYFMVCDLFLSTYNERHEDN